MKNQFLERFKDVCAELDKVVKPEVVQPKKIETRYNIHKRSLPVDVDKAVAFFLTKQEADMVMKRLKTRIINSGKVIYYDLVLNTDKEKNVFLNDKELTKPEGSDKLPEEAPIEIVTNYIG